MSRRDGEKNAFEKLVSHLTEPLWKDRELTDEEKEEMKQYAANPQAYVELTRTKIQNNNIANVIERQNELRAEREARERDQEAP